MTHQAVKGAVASAGAIAGVMKAAHRRAGGYLGRAYDGQPRGGHRTSKGATEPPLGFGCRIHSASRMRRVRLREHCFRIESRDRLP